MFPAQYQYSLKKYLAELLPNSNNNAIIDKIASNVYTQQDLEAYVKFFMGLYEGGYYRAVSEYKVKLEELGYKTVIK